MYRIDLRSKKFTTSMFGPRMIAPALTPTNTVFSFAKPFKIKSAPLFSYETANETGSRR